jgi:hypothetical protein
MGPDGHSNCIPVFVIGIPWPVFLGFFRDFIGFFRVGEIVRQLQSLCKNNNLAGNRGFKSY